MNSKTHIRSLFVAVLLLWLLPSAAHANLETERFWLQNTITRETFGPVVRQTGFRFKIKSEDFIVLNSVPGKIRVATYPDGTAFGPYDIVPGRILDLGTYAFTVLNVQTAVVPDLPPEMRDLSGFQVKGDPKKARLPEKPKFVKKEVPMEEWPLRIGGWLEPSRKAKYDWTVGGFAGEKALSLKSSRIGARVEWGNGFLQLGIINDSKQTGSLTPAMTSLDSLSISGGSGFSVSGGWYHPIPVEEHWDFLIGGLFEWNSESYDLNARALVRTETKVESETTAEVADDGAETAEETSEVLYSYDYRDVSSGLDLSEFILGLVGGIEYHEDIWGGRALLRADLLSDVSTSGAVEVNGTDLSVSGKRSHPIVAEFGAWCYWLDNVRTDLTFQFGSIQTIKLAAYWEF